MNLSNTLVPAKIFENVESCCPNKCFDKVNLSYQEIFFNNFWEYTDGYDSQSIILSGLMILKNLPADNNFEIMKAILWKNFFHCTYVRVEVCQQFLYNLLELNRKRFVTIQKKLVNNETIQDKRGTQFHRITKLTDELQKLIKDHCLSLPHSESHYSSEKCKLLTSDYPDLTNFQMMYST